MVNRPCVSIKIIAQRLRKRDQNLSKREVQYDSIQGEPNHEHCNDAYRRDGLKTLQRDRKLLKGIWCHSVVLFLRVVLSLLRYERSLFRVNPENY